MSELEKLSHEISKHMIKAMQVAIALEEIQQDAPVS